MSFNIAEQGRTPRHGRDWMVFAFVVVAAMVALWPAILNGFPLVYDDTSKYISSIREMRPWPVFYNLLPRVSRIAGTLWFVVLSQALVTTYILFRAFRLLAPKARWEYVAWTVGLIIALSQIPWLVSYVLPDFLGGLGLLSLITVIFAWERLQAVDKTLFFAMFLFSALAATANALVFIPLGGALIVAGWAVGRLRAQLLALFVLSAFLMVALPIAANTVLGDGPRFAIGSSARMFSKLVDNGLAVPFLEQHCAREHFHACEDVALIRNHVGGEGFLWDGPAEAHEERAWMDADGDYARLVQRIIVSNPLAVIKFMARDSVVLAGRTTLMSDNARAIIPHQTGDVPNFVGLNFPKDRYSLAYAKQQQGTLTALFPMRFYSLSVACSLVFAIFTLLALWHARNWALFCTCLSIVFGVVLAIIVHGSLSSPIARYSVKVSWLLWTPFALSILSGDIPRLLKNISKPRPDRKRTQATNVRNGSKADIPLMS